MTIKDAHQLNPGDTVKIKVSDYKTIQTQIESVSISETGPIIWYYNMRGELKSAECYNVEALNVASKNIKVKQFLDFLTERIDSASSEETETAYSIVKTQFKKMFDE